MTTEPTLTSDATINSKQQIEQEEARRKKLREQIELREMAKSLNIDDNDWDAAFGD